MVPPLNAYLFPPSSTTVTGITFDVTASSALSAKLAVAAGLNVVALAATEAEVAVTVGAKPLALVATEAV